MITSIIAIVTITTCTNTTSSIRRVKNNYCTLVGFGLDHEIRNETNESLFCSVQSCLRCCGDRIGIRFIDMLLMVMISRWVRLVHGR